MSALEGGIAALDRALVAFVTSGADWPGPHLDALRAAGARVRVCAPDRSLWSVLTALAYDVIVLADVEGGVQGLARALEEDGKLRTVPAVCLLAPASARSIDGPLPAIGSEDPHETVATLGALVRGHPSRCTVLPASASGHSLRPVSLPPPDAPARREIEAGFHDIRVLLGVVVGYGANLRDGTDGPLTEAQRGHVLKMMEAAADATVILEHTMSASRAVALGIPVGTGQRRGANRTQVDVSALAQSVVGMFSRAAEQRSVALVCEAPEPVHVWGNTVQLKQVVANLIVNALKFTPLRGRVRVATRVAVRGQAEIAVSDTGPGVPPEQRARIFEHGVRLERDLGVAGTGVGLAVVRELVVGHHGGSVRVDDVEGGGAEFVVCLPLDRRSSPRDGDTPSPDPAQDYRPPARDRARDGQVPAREPGDEPVPARGPP